MKNTFIAILVLMTSLLAGCATPTPRSKVELHTDKIYKSMEVMVTMGGSITGDQTYVQLDSKALPYLYNEFRSEIFKRGIVNGGQKFDCNHFSSYFVALAQTLYYVDHSREEHAAQNLALGQFWYKRDKDKPGNGHAVVVALTERGVVYFDPTLGEEVDLSDREKKMAFVKLF